MNHAGPIARDENDLSDETFRDDVRAWLAQAYPPELRHPPRRLHFDQNRIWYQILAKKGWLAPGWPREFGGAGLSVSKQLILAEEFDAYGCARLNDMGIIMLGPLLIRFGSEAQKQFFLPRIMSGEHIWCQGYSEPGAGSDLASLKTEARDAGDHWVLNGQKTWATLAADANWMFLLARTSRAERRQEGISFLLLEMASPGVTVRPILTVDMHDEFCEVFLDEVKVPKENILGEAGAGWTIAKALLGFERIFVGSPKQSQTALSKLLAAAAKSGVIDDSVFQDRYTRLALDLADLRCLYERYAGIVRRGEPLGPEVSVLKVFQTELYQRITEYLLEIAGPEAACFERPGEGVEATPASIFLQARPATIYGGSNEVQRNILAKNVLGLPT